MERAFQAFNNDYRQSGARTLVVHLVRFYFRIGMPRSGMV